MATTICMCSTMQRIDPQHLAWTLENLAEGKVVNQIKVPEHEALKLAKLANVDLKNVYFFDPFSQFRAFV
jgi:quinolinate synthase